MDEGEAGRWGRVCSVVGEGTAGRERDGMMGDRDGERAGKYNNRHTPTQHHHTHLTGDDEAPEEEEETALPA